jgi:hypothetical protein
MEDRADHIASNPKRLDGGAWRLGERMSLCRKRSMLMAIGVLAAGLSVGSTSALAIDCTNVTPFQAYAKAVQLGWGFRCRGPYGLQTAE